MASNTKKRKYTFLDKETVSRPRFSIKLAAVSLAILLGCLVAAWLMEGKGGPLLGFAGMVGALIAGFAFVVGMTALARHEGNHRLCVLGSFFSGIMAIIWLLILLNGLR